MNVVLIAEESAGIQVLGAIRDSGNRILGVLTSIRKTSSSGASVYKAAISTGLQVWPAEQVKRPELATILRSQGVDIILNVHSLYLIHEDVLRAPVIGAFNLHPGLLPRYAGLNTVSWSIYHGEKIHGVTLHKMVSEIDAGPIAYQSVFPIEDSDTALALNSKCVRAGVALIRELLETAENDPSLIPATSQDLAQRQYFGKQIPEGGNLCWDWPAEKVVNFVRACDYFPFRSPWGSPVTRLGDIEIAIVRAARTGWSCTKQAPGTVGATEASGVLVASADEWILIKKVKVGREYLAAADVLQPGWRLGIESAVV